MTGHKYSLSCLTQRDYPYKVQLGDDYQYPIKGMGEASYKMKSGKSMKMKEVLYVLGLKNNLLYISSLDKKDFRVSFVDGEVLMWSKGKTIDDVVGIGIEEGGIYKLKGHTDSNFLSCTISPCELWHRILDNVNYKALSIVSKVVIGLLQIHINNEGVWKGCAQGKNTKNPFPSSNSK